MLNFQFTQGRDNRFISTRSNPPCLFNFFVELFVALFVAQDVTHQL
ncbi:hypothetical protein GPLA_0782 [Paraglaciecola polaris LMG 21857]|uniref:Uncharacterized protein n=1 Tax=Paraglaciecola polaris LMG 21857 TaxID=1129793 RepID=K6ZS93_9ALTE|nr:hypothetical protein GPLA_0782 [Paraglaciecola polaris LMG 21857]